MLDSISANQLQEWMDYFKLEPFGYEIENYRVGIIASAIYNTNRQSKSDKTFSPDDFFNFDTKHEEKQSWEQQFQMAKAISRIYNQKGDK